MSLKKMAVILSLSRAVSWTTSDQTKRWTSTSGSDDDDDGGMNDNDEQEGELADDECGADSSHHDENSESEQVTVRENDLMNDDDSIRAHMPSDGMASSVWAHDLEQTFMTYNSIISMTSSAQDL